MLKQNQLLLSKIKIAAKCEKTDFSERHIYFYTKYSYFILKALKKASYQQFLCEMLIKENIKEKIVCNIDVNVYPSPRKNGNNIAGRCNTLRGKIRIYPKTIKFCTIFRKKFGRDKLFSYAGNRARAALIHELLHLKYTSDEEKVRELTKSYFSSYSKKQFVKISNAVTIYQLIFDAKSVKRNALTNF